jgi:anaerobic sulfite reductase subunit B
VAERAAASQPMARSGAMVPLVCRVAARRRETSDTWTVALERDGGGPLPRPLPGQFNMLYAFGVGEAPISASGDPAQPLLEHTVRAAGPVTSAICSARRGAAIGLRGPFGVGWPVADAAGRDVLVVAGGVGLAALRSLVLQLLARHHSVNKLILLCGGRSPGELLFRADLARWRRDRRVALELIVDRADAGWRGRVGLVTELIRRARFEPANAVAMVCGPEVMMRFAAAELRSRGVPPEAIHVSLERSMRCGIGHCGHCQLGQLLICRDGPVLSYDRVAPLLEVSEL